MKICPETLWESLARADETATFFQTPAWHKLAEDFEGTRSAPLLFDFHGSVAVLPLQTKRRWWGTVLTPAFGTYASLLRSPDLNPGHSEQIAQALSRLNLSIPGSPFSDLPNPATKHDHPSRLRSHTHILRLTALDPSEWVSRWSRNHRRLLKTAQDIGYSIRPAESTADVAAYFALYRAQTQRWGSAARRIYPEALFQEIFRRFAPAGSMKLWLAEGRDGIVGGRLCLYHGFHAVEWHAAAETEAMRTGVNHLLVHAIVSQARQAGYSVYDFNPNPGLDAVDHFKRGFATESIAFEGIHNRTGWVGILAAMKSRFKK